LVWMQPVTTSQELIWQTGLIGQHGLCLEGACPRSLVEHRCLSNAGPSMFDWSMLTVLTIVLSCDMIVIWWCYLVLWQWYDIVILGYGSYMIWWYGDIIWGWFEQVDHYKIFRISRNVLLSIPYGIYCRVCSGTWSITYGDFLNKYIASLFKRMKRWKNSQHAHFMLVFYFHTLYSTWFLILKSSQEPLNLFQEQYSWISVAKVLIQWFSEWQNQAQLKTVKLLILLESI
jgi:hypothetical protein